MNSKIEVNVHKLRKGFDKYDTTFEFSSTVHNIVSNKVLPDHIAEEGQKLYDEFKKDRLQVDKSIFDHMKLRKLQTFSVNKKVGG